MTYFISGHRDITPEEFEKFYVPAIVDVIDTCNDNYDDCEFVVGDCRGCDEMAANFIANYIKENTDDTECPPCILCIYHMFSEPRFRVGVAGQDGFYHVDMVDELNADLCEDDDPYTIDDCPIVHYVGGFETDRDRDSAMTNVSSEDIAFIRSKSKWDSGTAENILRRHTMKYLNPSFMDNSKDWGEFLEGIKVAQQATEAQKEANEQHEKYERLRYEFTLALINNNDLLHERSFKEICQLGVELTDEFMKHESEKGKV